MAALFLGQVFDGLQHSQDGLMRLARNFRAVMIAGRAKLAPAQHRTIPPVVLLLR